MCFLHRIDGDSLEEKLDPPMRQASNPLMPENKTNKIAGLFKGSCSVNIWSLKEMPAISWLANGQ